MTKRQITEMIHATQAPADDETPLLFEDVSIREFRWITLGELLQERGITYSHRNGETEAPTEPGAYWFKGDFYHGRVGDKSTRHPEQLLIQVEQSIHGLKFDEFACEVGRSPKHFAGQWWGPIVPPWEMNT